MKEFEKMKYELDQFISRTSPEVLLSGTVLAVNDDDTISVQFDGGPTIDDCRLKSIVKDGNKIIMIPKVASKVLCGRIGKSQEFVVVSVHEITDIKVKIDEVSFSIDNTGFQLSKDNDNIRTVFELIIQAVLNIVVIQGRNPDYVKLNQALTKVQNLFKDGTE